MVGAGGSGPSGGGAGATGGPPGVTGVLETCLYVDDMARAQRFYEDIIGLEPVLREDRLTTYRVGASNVLILFLRGGTLEPVTMPSGTIPAHDGAGPLHFCLSIPASDYEAWRDWLTGNDVPIVSEVDWPNAPGRSLYLHDPDGNVMELATPGLWGIGG